MKIVNLPDFDIDNSSFLWYRWLHLLEGWSAMGTKGVLARRQWGIWGLAITLALVVMLAVAVSVSGHATSAWYRGYEASTNGIHSKYYACNEAKDGWYGQTGQFRQRDGSVYRVLAPARKHWCDWGWASSELISLRMCTNAGCSSWKAG